MNPLPDPDPGAGAKTERLSGRQACSAALKGLLLAACTPAVDADKGPPRAIELQITCVDHAFSDWPLEDPAVQQALAAWLRRPGRRLQLIGVDFEISARRLPRFARWRREFGHRIDAWQPVADEIPAGLRGLLAGPELLQWLESPHPQLRRITNMVRAAEIRAEIADFLQRCAPAWPVTTLGL